MKQNQIGKPSGIFIGSKKVRGDLLIVINWFPVKRMIRELFNSCYKKGIILEIKTKVEKNKYFISISFLNKNIPS